MRQCYVQCLSPAGLHRMAYAEWGDPTNPRVVVCVHGLTRCGRDFDDLARALSEDFRVVCPDVVGRGRSDWLIDKTRYGIPQYLSDMVTLLARLDAESVSWVGTSMGGLIGMALAAQAQTPIGRLILNDVGPLLSAISLARIGEYVGQAPRFDNIEQAEQYVRFVSAPFGNLSDAQWRHLTVHTTKVAADGKIEFAYDPGIAVPFKQEMDSQGQGKDVDLWPLYEAIHCPTLVLRGAESDLLTANTAQEMSRRGPRARLVEFPGVGHAPMIMDPLQIDVVAEFLRASR